MSDNPPAREASGSLEQSDADDLARALEERERAARRHTLWTVLGVSPAGLIPLIAATHDFGAAALLVGVVCITGVEAWRAARARAAASELRARLDLLVPPHSVDRPDAKLSQGGGPSAGTAGASDSSDRVVPPPPGPSPRS